MKYIVITYGGSNRKYNQHGKVIQGFLSANDIKAAGYRTGIGSKRFAAIVRDGPELRAWIKTQPGITIAKDQRLAR